MPLANINGNEINYKDTGGDKPTIISRPFNNQKPRTNAPL